MDQNCNVSKSPTFSYSFRTLLTQEAPFNMGFLGLWDMQDLLQSNQHLDLTSDIRRCNGFTEVKPMFVYVIARLVNIFQWQFMSFDENLINNSGSGNYKYIYFFQNRYYLTYSFHQKLGNGNCIWIIFNSFYKSVSWKNRRSLFFKEVQNCCCSYLPSYHGCPSIRICQLVPFLALILPNFIADNVLQFVKPV